jgi:putative endonuclease
VASPAKPDPALPETHYMYFIYVLKSINSDRIYIGSTDDIVRRLQEHNVGKVKSSKPFKPYALIYKESYTTRSEARGSNKKIRYN